MVRAILAGQKTQTRRAAKPVRHPDLGNTYDPGALVLEHEPQHVIDRACPYGQPGDRLWVRETWQHANSPHGPYEPGCTCFYRADYWDDPHGMDGEKSPEGKYRTWIPSIHMFRNASRILLEIISVRVERLQEISPSDSIAEGIERTVTGDGWRRYSDPETEAVGLPPCQYPRHSYRSLWEHINGETSWDENPWVWVVEFKRIESPKGVSK